MGKADGPQMDQNEVDALLAAMQTGALPSDAAPSASPAAAPPEPEATGVVAYDFRHPLRLSKERLRAFELVHQVFARNAAATLTGQFLAHIELRLESTRQLTFADFLCSLPSPTCCLLLSRPALPGTVVLELNPTIAFPVIVHLLGRGRTPSPIPERPLTETEWSVLRTLADPLVRELEAAWATVKPVQLRIVSQESTPQLLAVAQPGEPVVLLSFVLAVEDNSGPVNLCIPHSIVEPFLAELAERGVTGAPRREAREAPSVSIREALLHVPITLAGVLAEMTLTAKDVLELAPEDRLETGRGKEAKIMLVAEGRPIFRGDLATVRRKRAIRITGKL
ncbi:MAG: FliM/FliN family flagellar motor switch protein [Planctomycetes bacterium]|nr:FliM/FliN family flagellar motor switch protein [Planctomycetota bacterium]